MDGLVDWQNLSSLYQLFVLFSCKQEIDTLNQIKLHDNLQDSKFIDNKPTLSKLKLVADLDHLCRDVSNGKVTYSSFIFDATLINYPNDTFGVRWGNLTKISTHYNFAGRGMEFSELIVFNERLYTCDDRTGIVFELVPELISIPYCVIPTGNGFSDRGMKTEWATTKNGKLIFGSYGREYVDDGIITSTDNNWITVIDSFGSQKHIDWTKNYNKIREAIGATFPGYVSHEAVNWSELHKKWFFLPRRVSTEPYHEVTDETKGSNLLVIADEFFENIQVREIGSIISPRGYSSFKFVPNSNDCIIIALKTEEFAKDNYQASYITIFTINGKILLPDTKIPGNFKFEGIAFF